MFPRLPSSLCARRKRAEVLLIAPSRLRLHELARVAEQTLHCFQHRLLATRRPSESYHGFRAANQGGGSLQGSIGLRYSFLLEAFTARPAQNETMCVGYEMIQTVSAAFLAC